MIVKHSSGTTHSPALLNRMSNLVLKTKNHPPADEISINAQLLTRAGYVQKLMGGVYVFLPLGKRVLDNIENVVRREMDAIGGQEIILPALHPKDNWTTSGRWDNFDSLYKIKTNNTELALGPTHEEVVTPMLGAMIESFRDLPLSVYQLQTKFRNELRAKAGLIRGREFRMKDMYSFHATQEDLDLFFEEVQKAYSRIFKSLGIFYQTYRTYASGGSFSKYSYEYQTICESGEDTIYVHPTKPWIAVNKEILASTDIESEIGARIEDLKPFKAIETANIFKLGTRFSSAFNISFANSSGQREHVIMGCYGLGTTRLMGTIVEIHHDQKGIIWPEEIAPYQVHFILVGRNQAVRAEADKIVSHLNSRGISVLYDDREGPSAGEKFKDAELLGIPTIMSVGDRSFQNGEVEVSRHRKSHSIPLLDIYNGGDF